MPRCRHDHRAIALHLDFNLRAVARQELVERVAQDLPDHVHQPEPSCTSPMYIAGRALTAARKSSPLVLTIQPPPLR